MGDLEAGYVGMMETEQWRTERTIHGYFADLEGFSPWVHPEDNDEEPAVSTPWMQLASGLACDLVLDEDGLPVGIKGFTLRDIAHSLSMQCRYAGHTRIHYSIAEHSVLVALRVWQLCRLVGYGIEDTIRATRAGLLHDASEAFLVDIPRPWKYTKVFKDYRKCEKVVQSNIFDTFDCKVSPDLYKLVERADNEMLAVEKRDVMRPSKRAWGPLPEPPAGFVAGRFRDQGASEAQFLSLAKTLGVTG